MGVPETGRAPSLHDVVPFPKNLTALPKKLLQRFGRTAGQYAAPDLHLMIQPGVIHHLQNRMDGACLRVVSTVYQAAHASMNGRSSAHGAGFNCSKQLAVAEPVITDVSPRFAQRHDLSMSGRIAVGEVTIPSAPNHASCAHYDRPYRHFSCLQGALSAAQGFFHPQFVHLKKFSVPVVSC
jgi:hypothetical protein